MDAWMLLQKRLAPLLPLFGVVLAGLLLFQSWIAWTTTAGMMGLEILAWAVSTALGSALAVPLWRFHGRLSRLTTLAATASLLTLLPAVSDWWLTVAAGWALAPISTTTLCALPSILSALLSTMLLHQAAPTQNSLLSGAAVCAAMILLQGIIGMPLWMPVSLMLVVGTLADETTSQREVDTLRKFLWHYAAMQIAAGTLLMSGLSICSRIFPLTLSTMTIAVVISATAGWAFHHLLQNKRFRASDFSLWAVAAGCLAIAPWLYDSLINWNLLANAELPVVRSVVLRHALQTGLWMTFVLLAFLICHRLTANHVPSQVPACHWILAGTSLTLLAAMSGIPEIYSLSASAAGLLLLAVWPALMDLTSRKRRRLATLCGAVPLVVAATILASAPDTVRPSRLLADLRPLAAIQRGIDLDVIPFTDATRLLGHRETADGTVTVWKTAASRAELRVNGFPLGTMSVNPDLAPQSIPEVAAAVLPFVLHPHAESALLMNDATGLALQTCRQLPMHTILNVPANISLVDGAVPLSDQDIVRRIDQTPEQAIRNSSLPAVDIIVDTLLDPARPASASRRTRAWYQAILDRMEPDGVFCQRLRQHRVGHNTVLRLVMTMSSVFEQTALLQITPGELLLLGSGSSRPLFDEGTMERMERQHVRRVLGQCGWDWCQLAALPVIDVSDPAHIWKGRSLPLPASAGTTDWILTSEAEAASFLNHGPALHALVADHQRQMVNLIPASPQHAEYRRRISAHAQQVELATAFPDQWWSYRKSLKSEMLRNQRPPIQTIADGDIKESIHPLDQFRKDYLVTLGRLSKEVREENLSVESLSTLTAFSVDYEPLISDFAHFELVRLHELAKHPAPANEFQHRLHSVNFTHAKDYSVRHVISALEQLTSQPELIADDASRYDQLNDLIQQLILRWEQRTTWEPRSALRTQRDVDLSVRVAQRALAQMESLAESASVERESFLTRRHFISDALVVPLRDYREQVVAHRADHEPLLLTDELEEGEVPLLKDEIVGN